ncbi:glycosyltransferase family 2 protein [Thalassobellus citreus]|uniref:glycosyltransferase family 2 protein n=1 Tax=Thalassobellus citreus TaxID=3367752 RepID=UPI0037BD4F6A
MIIVYHNNDKVLKVERGTQIEVDDFEQKGMSSSLFMLAAKYPKSILVWCHKSQKNNLNIEDIQDVFYLKNMMISYTKDQYLSKQIGYVDFSSFIKVNKSVKFPTWLMSSEVGAIYGSELLKFKTVVSEDNSLDYVLNSIAKIGMPNGLFCYSEPRLLKQVTSTYIAPKASISMLFKFVSQHYKPKWLFILCLCLLIYEKQVVVFSLLKALFYKKLSPQLCFDSEWIDSTQQKRIKKEIDVVIPTIGRKTYLYDVLKDLSNQTIVPKNVIIVEQGALPESVTELDYLYNKEWPFKIKHTFINKQGVGNARNLAIAQVESDWVFFGDDDIRFDALLFENMFKELETTGQNVGATVCLQPNQKQTYLKTAQTQIFGGGNSFLKTEVLKKASFNLVYEFNYGEDIDYGMQLRNQGEDVIFFANIKITHLKAPMGGYRTKFKQLWEGDVPAPKPSPAIQLLNQTYFTPSQLLGYKLILGIKFYKINSIKNPIRYIRNYKKRWERSEYWANVLKQIGND